MKQYLFIEKNINQEDPDRCVDGRAAYDSLQGAQMPGGTIHLVLIRAIDQGTIFDKEAIVDSFKKLTAAYYVPGAHRGHHKNAGENLSDCGAADKIELILTVAKQNRDEIIKRLRPLYRQYGDLLGSVEIFDKAYKKISEFDLDNIKLKAEVLIEQAEKSGAKVEDVEGNHAERKVFVNLKKGVTFDTKKANEQGWQAFNLDLREVMDKAEVLGVNPKIAAAMSLVLYTATEMVLVEKYGIDLERKLALPVEVYK